MIKLIVCDPFIVMGKTVYMINLKENNFPTKRSELNELLLNKEVEVFDVKCKVLGLEMYATPESYNHTDIGVMIEPI